jgi:hypothetical protein
MRDRRRAVNNFDDEKMSVNEQKTLKPFVSQNVSVRSMLVTILISERAEQRNRVRYD